MDSFLEIIPFGYGSASPLQMQMQVSLMDLHNLNGEESVLIPQP